MTWPLDQSPIPEPDEDGTASGAVDDTPRFAKTAGPSEGRRTNADDVLDAISGRAPAKKWDRIHCPLCGADTKLRAASLGVQTNTRRCQNPKCKNEFPVASVRNNLDVPPPPPNPLLLGGPFKGGPDRGVGRPPIDINEPIQRRIAEVVRRSANEDD
jgi:hypothetical protein